MGSPANDDLSRRSRGWSTVPEAVRKAYAHGYAVIPQTRSKAAIVKWARYRRKRPSQAQIVAWHVKWPECNWGLLTGRKSVVVLDFDGDSGLDTMKALGLQATIRTPHGAHVWVEGTKFTLVGGARVDDQTFPGMDVRADGQIATFSGGGYRRTGRAIAYSDLPLDVRSLLRRRRKARRAQLDFQVPDDFNSPAPHQHLLGEALVRLSLHTRNDTGFWLACQMRDERYTRGAIWKTMRKFAEEVADLGDHPYTLQEAYDSMQSALSQPPRLPRELRDASEIGFLSDVQVEPVSWLWKGRIPLRKVTILEGDPDKGKSTITLDLGARVSVGGSLPDGVALDEPGAVLVICAEDDLADTVAPRLLAAGANLEHIAYLQLKKDDKGRLIPLSIPEDMPRIERGIKEAADRRSVPPKLVIIDPITAYLSEQIHSGNDPQVRKAMQPLKQLAEETGVAILLVRHLNKDGSLRSMYRGGGSIAFSAAARSVLVVDRHPDQEGAFVLAPVKGNLAARAPGLVYRIAASDDFDIPHIEWGEQVAMDADALLSAGDSRKDAPARREAEQFLLDLLQDGPMDSQDVAKAADAAGLSMRTVKNAKAKLPIRSLRVRSDGKINKWQWELHAYVSDGVVHFNLE